MRLAVAHIVAPQGVHGEVRARCLTDFPERLPGRDVWLGETDRRLRIASARPHGRVLVLRLDGVSDRAAAEKLRGTTLAVDAASLAPLGPDEHYVHELIGLEVVTAAGVPVGNIADVLRPGPHDVYVVAGDDGRERLIPAVRQFVQVDLPGQRVTVFPIPGLLD